VDPSLDLAIIGGETPGFTDIDDNCYVFLIVTRWFRLLQRAVHAGAPDEGQRLRQVMTHSNDPSMDTG